MAAVVAWLFVAVGVLAVVAFVWASAWSADRYDRSFAPPDDLKRADEPPNPSGSPPGGSIWPGD